jgi:hypothetical protein
MPRITGKKGALYIPMGDGNSITNAVLTLSASKTLGGTTYTNRWVGTSARSAWNKSKSPSVRLQGFVGEVTITPSSTNNKVWVSANSYYKDNTTLQTGALTEVTLTRDAAKAQWHMIHVTMTTGAATVTAGTLSSDTSFNEVWDSAGGPGYVAATELLVGAVKLTPGGAGLVLASEIVYSLPVAGTLLQERSDLPGFHQFPLLGGVLLNEALLGCHAAAATRKAYATYYDQWPFLAKIGDMDGIALSGSGDTVAMEAMEDIAAEVDISGAVKASGTASRFYLGDLNMFRLAMQRRTGIMKVYPNIDDTSKYYELAVIMKSWGTDLSPTAAVKENVAFDVDGTIEPVGMA